MKIAFGCDHGALELKNSLVRYLKEKGYEIVDYGTFTRDSCDYADYAVPAARAVASGECDRGIVLCTTGIGVSITANKVPGIRCALVGDTLSAELTRRHNDTNVLALGAGITGELLAKKIVDIWLETPFSNEERHCRRIAKVMALEK